MGDVSRCENLVSGYALAMFPAGRRIEPSTMLVSDPPAATRLAT